MLSGIHMVAHMECKILKFLEVYRGLLCNMQISVICIIKSNHLSRLQTTHIKLHVHVKCFEFEFFFIIRLYLRIYLCGAGHLIKIVTWRRSLLKCGTVPQRKKESL